MITATAKLQATITATATLMAVQTGSCAAATVNVNSNLFDTVASGGTLNVPVKNTAGTIVGSIVGGEVIAPDGTYVVQNSLGQTQSSGFVRSGAVAFGIPAEDATAVVKNSANTTLATEVIPSYVTENIVLPDVNNVNSDGVVTPTPAGVAFTCTPQVKSLFSKFTWESGNDTTSTVTIDADSAGTYTSISDDGASGTITIDINSGGYGAFSNPTVFGIGDTVALKRTVTTSLGWTKISGTYV